MSNIEEIINSSKNKIYTGIGHRDIPEHVEHLINDFAKVMGMLGWTLRSGSANGSDLAFEQGCIESNGKLESYIPWNHFNGFKEDNSHIVATKLDSYREASQIAKSIHPNWTALTKGGKALHSRNVMQILGRYLQLPSDLVVMYAQPTGVNSVKGGTNTAYKVGQRFDIPTINLYDENEFREVELFVNKFLMLS